MRMQRLRVDLAADSPVGTNKGVNVLEVEMVVEIPQGSRNKYEMDHETGAIWLDRTLFTATPPSLRKAQLVTVGCELALRLRASP